MSFLVDLVEQSSGPGLPGASINYQGHLFSQKPTPMQTRLLYCCWVGSSDLDLLGNQVGFSTKPPPKKTTTTPFCRGIFAATKSVFRQPIDLDCWLGEFGNHEQGFFVLPFGGGCRNRFGSDPILVGIGEFTTHFWVTENLWLDWWMCHWHLTDSWISALSIFLASTFSRTSGTRTPRSARPRTACGSASAPSAGPRRRTSRPSPGQGCLGSREKSGWAKVWPEPGTTLKKRGNQYTL